MSNRTVFQNFDRKKIEDILFGALRAVYQFERIEVAQFDLTFQQVYLLKVLRRNPPMRLSDIAEELKIPMFGATRIVDQLEKRSFIERIRGEHDRRSIFVCTTHAGNRIIDRIEEHTFQTISSNLSGFSEDDVVKLFTFAANLEKLLGVSN